MAQLVGSNSLGLGKLIDGKNQFVHIMYSANADGSNMTADIQANTKYIGIVTSNSETAPTNPSDYSWGRFVGTSGTSSYTWLRYSPNENGSNMTANPTPETKYIGVAITADNNAPTDYTKYSWALIKGDDGRGISKTEVTYQKSTSGTVIPTGTWVTTIPTVNAGEYLWTRTLFTYTDNTTSSTYSVARSGVTGLGISRSDVDYQKSTSGTVAPTGAWTATIPTVEANEYLWTRTTLTYTNATTSVSYSVGKMGADGRDAQLLYLTASSQIQAFDKDDKPKTTQAITISVKLQNASGTATFVAIPYIGNVAQTAITLGGTGNDRTLLPSQWTNTQWTTIAITATLGSLTDTISVIKVKDGDTGKDGIAGKDGVGVSDTNITYAQSTSGTTPPSTGWTAQVPTLVKGQYLWTKTVWTYTDNSTETGYTVSYNAKDGNDGTDGKAGKDGVGIASTKVEYVGSTSGTVKPTTGWSTTIPTVAEGSFLWTRTTWTYTDSTSEVGYSVAKMGETGAKGDKGDSATSYWVTPSVNTIQISAAKVLNPTTVTFTGYSKTGTANAGLYAGRFNILTSVDGIVYSSKYSSSANQSTYTYTVPADVKFIKARMYQAGGFTALVDEVTIPIIESAEGLEISGNNMIIDSTNMLQSKVAFSGATGTKTLVDEAKSPTGKATKIRLSANTSTILFYFSNGKNLADPTNKTLLKGEIYTLSMMIRADVGFASNGVTINEAEVISHTFTQVTTEYRRVSVTFKPTVNSSTATNQNIHFFANDLVTTVGNDIYIHSLQLEKGNIATSWTPAPEDAKLYTAWSNDPNGKDMVRVYPNENLALGTQFKTVDDWAMTWATTNGTKTLTNDGLKLTATTANQTGMGGGLSRQLVYGEVVTVTFKFRGLGAVEPYFLMKSGDNLPITNVTSTSTTTWQEYSRGYAFPNRTEGILNFSILVRGVNNWIEIKKDSVKIEVGNKTIYTTPPSEDPVKAEMAYIGYSPKDSNDPNDYVWIENPKAVSLYTAWSNDPNGKDMVRVYPNENIALNYDFSKNPAQNGWTGNGATIEYVDKSMRILFNDSSTNRRVYYMIDELVSLLPTGTKYSVTLDAYSNNNGLIRVGNFDALSAWQTIKQGDTPSTYKFEGLTAGANSAFSIQGNSNTLIITITKIKIELGNTATVYTANRKDDPVKAEMAYIGYSVKDSNNPIDYTWSENPKAKGTFKRWSNDPNGLIDFTAVYPNENLLRTTTSESTIVGSGQSNQTDARTNYTLLTTPFNTLWADMKVGDTFTFSCDVNISGTGFAGQFRPQTASTIWLAIGSYYNVTKAETIRVSFTGTVTQSVIDTAAVTMIQIRYDNVPTTVSITVSKPKLERGSVATPYTTSKEEDLLLQMPQYVGIGSKDTMNPADFVWNINPEYNQARTDLGLDSKVDDETFNDAQDHMNEVVDGKADAQELQDLKDMADNLQQSYEGFVGEGGQHEADLQALEARVEGLIFELDEQVAAFDFVKTHMRLGEEGFEIAEEGSTMKMLLTNNALSFIDGGKEVASFSNQKFIINQGAIVESLQVGSHKMSRLSDKVTVFQYAPKTAVIK